MFGESLFPKELKENKVMSDTNFKELRDQWALKAGYPGIDQIRDQSEIDRMANPYNEPYPNMRPRRSDTEIISDLAYHFADGVLSRQYGYQYKTWLKDNCEEKWGCWKYAR